MNRAELKANAKQQIKGNVFILLVITVLTGIIAGTMVGSLLVPALSISLCAIYLGMANGEKASVGNMFCRVGTFFKSWWLMILISIFTSLWSILLVIPGIIKGLSYSMAPYVMAEHPDWKARACLSESKRIMKGHVGELFVLQLSFIGWHILGGITFGIAYIWIIPYICQTTANFYNAIKE